MPKDAGGRQSRRHNPLENDILATGILRTKPGKRKSKGEDDAEENFVNPKMSRNILRLGRELADEGKPDVPAPEPTTDTFGYDSRFDDEAEAEDRTYDDDEAWGDDDEVVEEVEIDPEDLDTYKKFMPDEEDDLLKHGWDRKPTGEQEDEPLNLADLILAKIAAHEARQEGGEDMAPPDDDYELPPKVVEVYTK